MFNAVVHVFRKERHVNLSICIESLEVLVRYQSLYKKMFCHGMTKGEFVRNLLMAHSMTLVVIKFQYFDILFIVKLL